MQDSATANCTLDQKYVLVRLDRQLFGIPADRVSEMIQVPPLTRLPKSPEGMRGVFVQRGESIAALDLRTIMGMPTIATDMGVFRDMLRAREQDHRNWIAELEASVREVRPFHLATDPHKCAFGKWYDTFESTSVLIEGHLQKFDGPHRRIHAVAVEVSGLVAQGNPERALERIEETRDVELREMIVLFAQFHELLESTCREISVVLGAERVAYCVDTVESVLDIGRADESDEPPRVHPSLARRGLKPVFVGPDREVALLMSADHLPGVDLAT